MIGDPETTTNKPESINEPPGSNVIPPESEVVPEGSPPTRKVPEEDDDEPVKRKSRK